MFLSVRAVVLAKQNLPKSTEICTEWAVEVHRLSVKKRLFVVIEKYCSFLPALNSHEELIVALQLQCRRIQEDVCKYLFPPAAPGLLIKRGRMHDWEKCRPFTDVLNN